MGVPLWPPQADKVGTTREEQTQSSGTGAEGEDEFCPTKKQDYKIMN